MWTRRKYEEQMQARLKAQFDEAKADSIFSIYQTTREKLTRNVFPEIKGAEPSLSDHSADHIANVLDNTHVLLAEGGTITCLDGVELYCLGMMILFHDVGNLYGRRDHNKKIAEIFDWARGTEADVRREKVLIITAAKAHTGKAADGTNDTLKGVSQQPDHLWGERVRLQDLAAVLRFADELAEGPQRTSEYMRTKGHFPEHSQIYHDYASMTHVRIDRGNERIALTYEIEVEQDGGDEALKKLRNTLEFIYGRALKLDQERRYARFYSDLLAPFKATWITLNFHCVGHILEINQPPLKLDDKVIPGDTTKSIPQTDPAYEIETMISRVAAQVKEVTP